MTVRGIRILAATLGVAAFACGTSMAFAQAPERANSDGPAVPPAFARLDRDGDGALSKEETPPRVRERFEQADRDGDGKLSVAEMRAAIAADRDRPAPGGARPDRAVPEDVRTLRDVAYVPDGHERQKLDLYLPNEASAEAKLPLVVWIHGGGWRGGSKEGCPARFLTGNGFAVASLNYRLSGHAPFPAQIEDCKTAIRFLRANADKYGYDPEKIGVWGSSAGGHLVSLLGTAGDVAEFEGPDLYREHSSRVQAVCNYYGPSDLPKMGAHSGPNSRLDHDSPNSPESLLLGGPILEKQDLARLASPITHVTKDDPPFLTVHGDSDPVVPVKQGQSLHEALEKAGVDSELYIVEGGGHGGFRDASLNDRVTDFFERTLKGEPEKSDSADESPAEPTGDK